MGEEPRVPAIFLSAKTGISQIRYSRLQAVPKAQVTTTRQGPNSRTVEAGSTPPFRRGTWLEVVPKGAHDDPYTLVPRFRLPPHARFGCSGSSRCRRPGEAATGLSIRSRCHALGSSRSARAGDRESRSRP